MAQVNRESMGSDKPQPCGQCRNIGQGYGHSDAHGYLTELLNHAHENVDIMIRQNLSAWERPSDLGRTGSLIPRAADEETSSVGNDHSRIGPETTVFPHPLKRRLKGSGKSCDCGAEIRCRNEHWQEHDCLGNGGKLRLPRHEPNRGKTEQHPCPPGKFAHAPQEEIKENQRVQEPRHGVAYKEAGSHLAGIKDRITKNPVVLDALRLLLNEHPHHVRYEEKPQAASKELGKAKTKYLLGEIATNKEKEREA